MFNLEKFNKKEQLARFIRDDMLIDQIIDISDRKDKSDITEMLKELICVGFPVEFANDFNSFKKFDNLKKIL